jgi:predicted nucleic acid-binding protein
MRIAFDTNVVLDLLLDRAPFVEHAAELFSKVERSELSSILCATTITTIHYLANKAVGAERAAFYISKLLGLCEIAPVNRAVLEDALASGFSDFEDAVLHESARHAGCDALVTRNVTDFSRAHIRVYTPTELLAILRPR